MKYDKAKLIAQLTAARESNVQRVTERHLKSEAQYEEELAQWTAHRKERTLARLASAEAELKALTKAAKADRPVSSYALRSHLDRLDSPPERPAKVADVSCVPAVRQIDDALEFLGAIKDEEVSSYALNQAGIKDVYRLTRRVC